MSAAAYLSWPSATLGTLHCLAKHAALCGFLYIVSMLLVCFDPPLERHSYPRSFNSQRRVIVIPHQLVSSMRFT